MKTVFPKFLGVQVELMEAFQLFPVSSLLCIVLPGVSVWFSSAIS